MRKRSLLLRTIHLLTLLAAGSSALPARAAGPLRVSPDNPRYFTDDTGRAIYLTGMHTWTNFVDRGTSFPPPAFDYAAYLDDLVRHGHNFFRLWTWEQSRWSVEHLEDEFWYAPGPPWQRTGPGLAADGLPRFDLTRFSQPYFDRLRSRCLMARFRGIYASIMLFDGWSVARNKAGIAHQNPWLGHPFRAGNNINGIDGDLNGDESGEEVHELLDASVIAVQEAYVRKVIDTVNDLDNVLYEISNESHSGATGWQEHVIALVHSYEAAKPKQHPVGMTAEYPGGRNEDLFASEADWISPNGTVADRPVSSGQKVIVADTDHLCGVCGDPSFPWRSLLRGENPIFMDSYNGSQWEAERLNLGYARRYAQRINLITATPSTVLSSTGYCLANEQPPSAEYLVYGPGGSFTLDMSANDGTFNVEWFSPEEERTFMDAVITGGAVREFTPPFGGAAVLYLYQHNPASTEGPVPPAAASLTMPNPFYAPSEATLRLPRAGRVAISVFDVQGRRVWATPETAMEAGSREVPLAFETGASGLFFWELQVDGSVVDRGKVFAVR